jgi:two-component system alkaline phosphatase synthesis response regulator PhoP
VIGHNESSPRKVVLVADDNEDILALIAVSLKLADLEVLLARDGEEALELALDRKPDLAVLDVRMPHLNGHEVLRRIRRNSKLEMPVILVSAMASEEAIAEGRREGADDYITKPFRPQELLKKAEAALAGEPIPS